MDWSKIEDVKALLAEPKNIIITTHERPDGDALGSSLALKDFLAKEGHNVSFVAPSDYPEFYGWMPLVKESLVVPFHNKAIDEAIEKCEVLFCLDFNDIRRTGKLSEKLVDIDCTKVLIDHHLNPTDYADYTFSNVSASSTAELIFEFIIRYRDEDAITRFMAENIYTGILTDTGAFQFSSTTPRVHEIVGKLLEKGVKPHYVQDKVFNSFSYKRLQLFGHCLTNNFQYIEKYKLAIITISKDDVVNFDIKSGDTEGLVNYGLKIADVNFAAIFKEHDDRVKISFRSKGDVDVNTFARTHFDGGGHKNAAGGISFISLDETVAKFIRIFDGSNSEQS